MQMMTVVTCADAALWYAATCQGPFLLMTRCIQFVCQKLSQILNDLTAKSPWYKFRPKAQMLWPCSGIFMHVQQSISACLVCHSEFNSADR